MRQTPADGHAVQVVDGVTTARRAGPSGATHGESPASVSCLRMDWARLIRVGALLVGLLPGMIAATTIANRHRIELLPADPLAAITMSGAPPPERFAASIVALHDGAIRRAYRARIGKPMTNPWDLVVRVPITGPLRKDRLYACTVQARSSIPDLACFTTVIETAAEPREKLHRQESTVASTWVKIRGSSA